MDKAPPKPEQKVVAAVMDKYRSKNVEFHALRIRQAASQRFVSVYVLVSGNWTIHDARHLAEDFECDIRAGLGRP